MSESTQHKLSRMRPPRVQITYDVETAGAIEKKELPFVVGVMADLSGAKGNATRLAERPFVEIDRDNFGAVMAQLAPTLKVQVPNPDAEGDQPKTVSYDLTFTSLDDFKPDALVKALSKPSSDSATSVAALWERREFLRDMLTKLDGNDELREQLNKIVNEEATLKALLTDASGFEEPKPATET